MLSAAVPISGSFQLGDLSQIDLLSLNSLGSLPGSLATQGVQQRWAPAIVLARCLNRPNRVNERIPCVCVVQVAWVEFRVVSECFVKQAGKVCLQCASFRSDAKLSEFSLFRRMANATLESHP